MMTPIVKTSPNGSQQGDTMSISKPARRLGAPLWTALLCFVLATALPPALIAEEPTDHEEHPDAEEHESEHEGEHGSTEKRAPYVAGLVNWFFVSVLPGEDDAETYGLEIDAFFDLGPYRVKNINYFELADYPRQIPGQPPGNENVEPGVTVNTGVNDLITGFWGSRRGKPHRKHHVAWGAAFQWPTASNDSLGSGKYSLGPTVDYEYEHGNWFAGFIAIQFWSAAGDSARKSVNYLMVKPFAIYEINPKWSFTYLPYGISVYWEKPSGEDIYFPVGGGFQRKLGKRTNVSLQGFQNVLRPTKGTKYDVRLMLEFLFE